MSIQLKKKFPILLIVIVGILFVIVIIFLFNLQGGLSKQQKQLVERFGYPNTFMLTFGEMAKGNKYQTVRFEAWNYHELGRRFYFVDGEFQKDVDIDIIKDANYPKLTPEMFRKNASYGSFLVTMETSPVSKADIIPEIMEDTTVYNYNGQVKVAVSKNKVIYIETFPVLE